MPNIHFFTDPALISLSQASDDNFGPTSTDLSNKYKVTSLHSGISSDPIGYAVCNGRVRFQNDSTNPLLLNMILIPDSPIFNNIPVAFFIYRGILKSSLLIANCNFDPTFSSNKPPQQKIY